jgi:hypothetical protein
MGSARQALAVQAIGVASPNGFRSSDRTRIVASIFSRALGQLAIVAALGVAWAAVLANNVG